MKNKFGTIFCCVIYLIVGAFAEDEIKRGSYPFMAFVYYQDETILGLGGARFLQGAVLVRPNFLISSSLESTISKDPLSKTMLARLGATVIDPKFTLNEDEDEQEQEVIQITQPSEHDISQWWLTDICLLKTLQPVISTNSVRFTQLSTKQEAADKVCHILLYKWLTDICLLKTLQPVIGTNSVRFTQLSTKQEAADKVCHILLYKWLTDICLLKTLQPVIGTNSVRFTQLSTKQEAADKVCHILLYKWLTDICLLKTLQPVISTNSVRFTQLSTKQEAADKVCHILLYKKKSGTDVRVLTRMFVEMLPASSTNCGEHFVRGVMTCAADQQTGDGLPPAADFCQGNNGGPLICDNDVIALQTYINGDCKAPHLYQLLSPRKQFLDCGIEEKCGRDYCHNVCTVIQKDAPLPTHLAPEATTLEATTEVTTEATTASDPTKTIEPETTESDTSPTASPTTLTTPMTTAPFETSSKSWPNEREGRKMSDEDSDTLNRTVSVEAKSVGLEDDEIPRRHSGSPASNLALFQSLVCYVFLCVLS
ncbi:uncharacterized protein LOC125228646 [Leguminivora glycinivorella]|uniref:uncharacterized protein LOC125228646 n=1 Tax=Leguminivora glycinivorella TaxID=1035111 RepID=UPI00201025F6|nr:uncharacterized protein LOC125228646 [Leguminivora glycinivorella]